MGELQGVSDIKITLLHLWSEKSLFKSEIRDQSKFGLKDVNPQRVIPHSFRVNIQS